MFPGGRNGNPLHHSCLENHMDTGTWWAIVHGLQKLGTTEWLNSKQLIRIFDKKDTAHTHTHTHTRMYNGIYKNNEIKSFAATWRDLEIIILNEVSHTEKYKYITYMWNLKKGYNCICFNAILSNHPTSPSSTVSKICSLCLCLFCCPKGRSSVLSF